MNVKIQEDSRTLREFYPDPTLRHQVHYAFAHRFVPQYVQQNPCAFFSCLYNQDLPGGAQDPTRFIHSRWSANFEEMIGLAGPPGDPFGQDMVFRRVTDLTMSIQELAGRASALIEMPTPEQPVEAYFACIVFQGCPSLASSWPRDLPARVFTLEAEFSDRPEGKTGIVCEWTKGGEHRNFGLGVRADRNAFLRAVASLLEAPETAVAGSCVPANGEAPATVTLRMDGRPSPGPQTNASPETKKPWWKIW